VKLGGGLLRYPGTVVGCHWRTAGKAWVHEKARRFRLPFPIVEGNDGWLLFGNVSAVTLSEIDKHFRFWFDASTEGMQPMI